MNCGYCLFDHVEIVELDTRTHKLLGLEPITLNHCPCCNAVYGPPGTTDLPPDKHTRP